MADIALEVFLFVVTRAVKRRPGQNTPQNTDYQSFFLRSGAEGMGSREQ